MNNTNNTNNCNNNNNASSNSNNAAGQPVGGLCPLGDLYLLKLLVRGNHLHGDLTIIAPTIILEKPFNL